MDGCSSHKHLRGAGSTDTRVFKSSYFLSRKAVDVFKDEIKSRAQQFQGRSGQQLPSVSKDKVCDDNGLLDESDCTTNWKAAHVTELGKGAAEVFDQMGIFASLCQHGIVEWVTEIIWSGEL